MEPFCFFHLCLSCCRDCSLQPCGYLGSLVCDVFLCFLSFPMWYRVWYLIVSIPVLCLFLTSMINGFIIHDQKNLSKGYDK